MECLLPPLLEVNDHLTRLNDVDEVLRKVIEADKNRPKVLYLQNDEGMDEEGGSHPAFIEDDAFDSEANFDGVFKKAKN